MYFIMLCGQGSTGKSTFGKFLKSNLLNTSIEFIQMDRIVGQGTFSKECIKEYVYEIQCAIDGNVSIIADFSQDSISCREHILNNIIFLDSKKIDLVTVSMRPDIDALLDRESKRKNIILEKEDIDKISTIYNSFIFPTNKEFEKYHFNSITHFVIQNDEDYNKVLNFLIEQGV